MCIVVDANTFSKVFNPKDNKFADFEPMRAWILSGPGKLVYGGTKYLEELTKANKFLPLFAALKAGRKAVEIDRAAVDTECSRVEKLRTCTSFDDPQIVASVSAAAVGLLTTDDKGLRDAIKSREIINAIGFRPRIYSRPSNKSLLTNNRIAPCCK